MLKLKHAIINFLYITIIFGVSLTISSLALVRKVNKYRSDKPAPVLTVEKDQIAVTNTVTGKIRQIHVHIGQHVSAGDLLVELGDDDLKKKILALQSFSDQNISAQTEAALLRTQLSGYQITAPRPGVVHQILTAEGSYLPSQEKIMVILADDFARLKTLLTIEELDRLQSLSQIDVYSPRLEQTYQAKFVGVDSAQVDLYTNRYQSYFSFINDQEGQGFIHGEILKLIPQGTDATKRPADLITDVWNSLIIGEN